MRHPVKIILKAALLVSAMSTLAACGRGAISEANLTPNQVTGVIDVSRSLRSCDATVRIHNGTANHIDHAGFGITGYDSTLSVKDVLAGGDDSDTLNIPMDADGSCVAVAHAIEAHATDNNVGTCAMPNVTEGDCQRLFVFHSAINGAALAKDISQLVAGNLKAGDDMPLKDGGWDSVTVATQVGGDDAVRCADNTAPNWSPAIEAVHTDGDGVATAYQIGGTCTNGDTAKGWVARSEPSA